MSISVTVNKPGTSISVTTGATTVSTPADTRTVTVNNSALAAQTASTMQVTPSGTISSTTLQGAIDELAGDNFRSNDQPSGAQVEEGDTWYDLDDNQYKIYRETSSGVFQWVPIMVGSADGDSDTLDAGAF
tara:strand:+ start:92 stop:484 length:393 start_codon:yes stop_codon:yes gene_type:complete